MKKLVVFVFVLSFILNGYSQNRSRYNRNDYAKLSLAGYIGGLGYGAIYESGKTEFNIGYILGANVDIRPTEKFGLTTGYAYSGFSNGIHYSSIPLLFNFYYDNIFTIAAGPILFFNNNQDEEIKNPVLGGAVGYKTNNLGLYFIYNPQYTIFQSNEDRIKMFFGLGLIISLPVKII